MLNAEKGILDKNKNEKRASERARERERMTDRQTDRDRDREARMYVGHFFVALLDLFGSFREKRSSLQKRPVVHTECL